VYFTPTEEEYPVVLDSGASTSIMPYRDDFIGMIKPCKMKSLKGLTDTTPVIGRGWVEWSIVDVFGVIRTIKTRAYFVPLAKIRLFSPQAYFQEHDAGHCVMNARSTTLTLADDSVLVFPNQQFNNLPFMLPSKQWTTSLMYEGCKFLSNQQLLQLHLSVADKTNQNLTASQRELLLWHWRLGHANHRGIQKLFAKRKLPEAEKDDLTNPILQPKAPKVSSCPAPLCAARQ
jgi:hypothetical protein